MWHQKLLEFFKFILFRKSDQHYSFIGKLWFLIVFLRLYVHITMLKSRKRLTIYV